MKTDMRRQVLSGMLQQKICSIKETGELRMEVPKADAAGKTAELDREKTLAVQKNMKMMETLPSIHGLKTCFPMKRSLPQS